MWNLEEANGARESVCGQRQVEEVEDPSGVGRWRQLIQGHRNRKGNTRDFFYQSIIYTGKQEWGHLTKGWVGRRGRLTEELGDLSENHLFIQSRWYGPVLTTNLKATVFTGHHLFSYVPAIAPAPERPPFSLSLPPPHQGRLFGFWLQLLAVTSASAHPPMPEGTCQTAALTGRTRRAPGPQAAGSAPPTSSPTKVWIHHGT